MESRHKVDLTTVLNGIASTLQRIDDRLEEQGNVLKKVTATQCQQRNDDVWPRIDPSDDLVLLEAAAIALPDDAYGSHNEDRPWIKWETFSYADARGPNVRPAVDLLVPNVPYDLSDADRHLLGDLLDIPFDGRLPLIFSKAILGLLPRKEAQESIQNLAKIDQARRRNRGHF
ncbi:MAG: hypothetical protein Q9170_006230 [Blastenia crenularia]